MEHQPRLSDDLSTTQRMAEDLPMVSVDQQSRTPGHSTLLLHALVWSLIALSATVETQASLSGYALSVTTGTATDMSTGATSIWTGYQGSRSAFDDVASTINIGRSEEHTSELQSPC